MTFKKLDSFWVCPKKTGQRKKWESGEKGLGCTCEGATLGQRGRWNEGGGGNTARGVLARGWFARARNSVIFPSNVEGIENPCAMGSVDGAVVDEPEGR